MPKLNDKAIIELSKLANEAIELAEQREDMPYSDYQGAMDAILINAYLLGVKSK